MACSAFVVCSLLICLIEVCVVGKTLKVHVHAHSLWGDAQVEASSAERRRWSAAQLLLPALGDTHPCAQAIIVNDKVTIEVIIVLN